MEVYQMYNFNLRLKIKNLLKFNFKSIVSQISNQLYLDLQKQMLRWTDTVQ